MLLVGLTGNIASGKTTVSQLLSERGATIIDADVLARRAVDRDLRETDAMDMIAAQMPAELKRARADFVIDNAGSLSQLEQRVADVWSSLLASAESQHATVP